MIKNPLIIGLFLSGAVILASCGKPENLTAKEYQAYVENPENGLIVSKVFDDYSFELFCKPAEYIALNEQHSFNIDWSVYEDRIEQLGELQYFTFKIKSLSESDLLKAGIGSENEYYNRLYYLTDVAQNDIVLIENEDTLSCVLYHFERNYGIAPYNNIVLGFPKSNRTSSKMFSFNEQTFGVGKINLVIEEKNLVDIPELIQN